jgi:hypothetical protein
MNTNPENTLQQLSRVHYQRTALQGVNGGVKVYRRGGAKVYRRSGLL